jgi:hypothetical protein
MNRRQLLRDVGVAVATASPLLASSASQAQGGTAGATVLIAYHSVSGNTETMAQGVAEGGAIYGAFGNGFRCQGSAKGRRFKSAILKAPLQGPGNPAAPS